MSGARAQRRTLPTDAFPIRTTARLLRAPGLPAREQRGVPLPIGPATHHRAAGRSASRRLQGAGHAGRRRRLLALGNGISGRTGDRERRDRGRQRKFRYDFLHGFLPRKDAVSHRLQSFSAPHHRAAPRQDRTRASRFCETCDEPTVNAGTSAAARIRGSRPHRTTHEARGHSCSVPGIHARHNLDHALRAIGSPHERLFQRTYSLKESQVPNRP
jgi:hypothetical protein